MDPHKAAPAFFTSTIPGPGFTQGDSRFPSLRFTSLLAHSGSPPDPSHLCPSSFASLASAIDFDSEFTPSVRQDVLTGLVERTLRLCISSLSVDTARSCCPVVSSGWLCPEVCRVLADTAGPLPSSLIADTPDVSSTTSPDIPPFGHHAPFHSRRRRPSAGSTSLPRPPTLAEIITAQRTCDEYRHIYAYLSDGPAYLFASGLPDASDLESGVRSASAGYRLVDGVLVRLDASNDSASFHRIVLPPCFHTWALHAYHDLNGHQGVQKTLGSISRLYYWPNLHSAVHDHIRRCDVCSRSKVSRSVAGEFHLSGDGDHPWCQDSLCV